MRYCEGTKGFTVFSNNSDLCMAGYFGFDFAANPDDMKSRGYVF